MKIVPESSLQKALSTLEEMSQLEIDAVMDTFADRQPAILAFTLSLEEDFDDPEDFQVLFHNVVVIWQAFEIAFGSLPRIREEQILQKEEESIAAVMDLAAMSEEEMLESAMAMFAEISQPVLMKFVSEELASLEADGELAGGEDAAGHIFPLLKIVVELFHDAVNKPSMRVV